MAELRAENNRLERRLRPFRFPESNASSFGH